MRVGSRFNMFAIVAAVFMASSLAACSGDPQPEADDSAGSAYAEGEHAEGGEGGERQESGVYIGVGETWDVTRRGARLVLAFDAESGAFKGRVLNTTESTLCAVRVEVHLSTGTELGPTSRTDVPAGQTISVALSTGGEEFDSWTAHPEMSACSSE